MDEIKSLELSFPEDREFLITYITNEIQSSNATCGSDDLKITFELSAAQVTDYVV